jgi:hypothetical protein
MNKPIRFLLVVLKELRDILLFALGAGLLMTIITSVFYLIGRMATYSWSIDVVKMFPKDQYPHLTYGVILMVVTLFTAFWVFFVLSCAGAVKEMWKDV